MSSSIQINADALVKRMDVFTKVQMPFITSLALNNTATKVRDDLRTSMRETFTYLTPYTQNSVFIRASSKQKLYVDIGIKEFGAKGNAAADYLKPQVYGGQVYLTRFQKRLKRNLGMQGYMLPIHGSDAAQLNPSGRIAAGQYTAALYGIRAMEDIRSSGRYGKFDYKTLGSYLYVRPGATVYNKDRRLAPGIYRVQGNSLSMLFKELRRPPNVPSKWKFFDITQQSAQRALPGKFDEAFMRALGRANM